MLVIPVGIKKGSVYDMYYVYRFLDQQNNVVYVGKSKQALEQRFKGHAHLPDQCYAMTYKIEYIECATESDMSIKEIYYINKYRNSSPLFNMLDTTELPTSVIFNDEWMMYTGPLEEHFRHSINYLEGYTQEKTTRYNMDGSVDKRKPNSKKGESHYVEPLTKEDITLLVEHFIAEINSAENNNQEQLRFRNLVMFILGINLPIKTNDFLQIKYKDLFDENDLPKAYEMQLSRFYKDETLHIPLRSVVKKVLLAYTQKYGLTYKENANDEFFQSRKHQVVSPRAWWNILSTAAKETGITTKIGTESLKKTYGLNVYEHAKDKLNALLFLGELWGRIREAQVIKYLNLSSDEIDFDYYFGEDFSLGDVDFSLINCLQP